MNSRVAALLIVLTVLVAIVGFLLVSFLFRSAEQPGAGQTPIPGREGWVAEQRQVGDASVIVEYDPNRRVVLQQEPPVPTNTPAIVEPPVPTNTPDPGAPTATPTAGAQPGDGTQPGAGVTVVAPVAPSPDKVIFVAYRVQAGDTLYSIAQYHNNRDQITSVALMARYGISANKLETGKDLSIPYANPAYCPGLRPYVVLESDNAFRIAQKFGVTVEWLRQTNNLDANYTVRLSDVLCVP